MANKKSTLRGDNYPMSRDELEALRQAEQWTVEQAAGWAGVSPDTWRSWELGEAKPPVMLSRLISNARQLCELEEENSPRELKAFREQRGHGYSIEEAASWAGVDPSVWKSWEDGKAHPPTMLYRLISHARKLSELEHKLFLHCSFCDKSQNQVRRLIAGPKVYICDECVEICVEVIDDMRIQSREEKAARRAADSADDAE